MTRPSSPALWISLLLTVVVGGAFPDAARGQADEEPGAESSAPAPPEEPRATFDVALEAAEGGGRVTGEAGDFQLEPGRFLLATGGVKIKYRDLVVEAQTVRLDIPDNRVTAEGDVILDEGPQRLVGDSLEYDLDTRTGRVTNARASIDSGYYFTGDTITKTGEVSFTIENGVFTSCEGDSPAWSFKTSDASITLEEYARIRNARLRFGKVPVLYVPYILWPATTERSSGWLIPKPGYSDRRGAHVSLAYYRTLGRSADTTFYFDLSTEEYNGLGAEYRYRPSENTTGVIEAYYLFEPIDLRPEILDDPIYDPDRERGDDRWKFIWAHETKNLWGDWRGVIDLELYSDFDYLRDVERSVDRQTRSFLYSNAFLTQNRGSQSWNLMVDQRDRINSDRSRITLRQLPEVEYRVRSTRLGSTNVYFDFLGSANYFSVEAEEPPSGGDDGIRETTSFEYGRVDIAPSLSVPLSTLPWLSVKATVAGRVTHYTDSLPAPEDPVDPTDPLSGGSLTRTFPSAAVEIIGPSFSRIFESSDPGRFAKWKHLIEPRITYTWVDEFDDSDQISIFDEIDTFLPRNAAVVSIINRLLAKPTDEEEGGAFEIASFEVAQAYIFDDFDEDPDNDDSDGPLVGTLRINPSDETSLQTELQYEPDTSQLTRFRLSGNTRFTERFAIGLSWFTSWNALTGDEIQDQLRASTEIELVPDRLIFGAQVSYDLLDDLPPEREALLSQRYVLDYRAECYSWLLEFRDNTFEEFEDTEVRFSLSLKNVGTFLDLNESF